MKFKKLICKIFGHRKYFDDYDFADETVEFWYCRRCGKEFGEDHYSSDGTWIGHKEPGKDFVKI